MYNNESRPNNPCNIMLENENFSISTSVNDDILNRDKYESIQKEVIDSIPNKLPGKNISIYLSYETLTKLNAYIKNNKIKNRSIFIEKLLLKVLFE